MKQKLKGVSWPEAALGFCLGLVASGGAYMESYNAGALLTVFGIVVVLATVVVPLYSIRAPKGSETA